MKTQISAGISDCACEMPEDWEAIAQANSRAMDEDRATRKSLCSNSPSQIEGLYSEGTDATVLVR
jgi:hypothetical protein